MRRVVPAAAAFVFTGIAAACGGEEPVDTSVQTVAVERRDIVVDVEATGVVEPINVVEVKSKASGQITRMPVETGSLVEPGDLLVQLDTRDVRNQYDQAVADVRAAEARLSVSESQKKRVDELFAQRIVTAQEHETANLDHANARAALVRARTGLDLAQQRLDDATVRAPVRGTVIEKTVSLGQVITSATGSFGGGTTLLKMADLDRVRVRALVNETDIGNVRSGQSATVSVDAYPDRPFSGTVDKIEPQAVVQQSVTMFPVLISIANREALLKPGMNGEVAVLVERRMDVVAVPNEAVRTPREAVAAAELLGLSPESVRDAMQSQMGGGRARGGVGGGGTDAPAGVSPTGSGAAVGGAPPVRLAMQSPAERRRGMRRDGSAPTGETAPAGAARGRPGLVFVAADSGFAPRFVLLGVGNYDYSEVLRGVAEGERVAILSAAALQAQQREFQDRIRNRSGIPGMQRDNERTDSSAPRRATPQPGGRE
ncbi:MAG: efflux RND transporter periplasmic adaptor subunit [Gemmatimonadaceae bacterium]